MSELIRKSYASAGGVSRTVYKRNDDLEAEACDPYAMGYEAGADLDDPPPCPFKNGIAAKLWRQGFSARVDEHIANAKRFGGLSASITKSTTPD